MGRASRPGWGPGQANVQREFTGNDEQWRNQFKFRAERAASVGAAAAGGQRRGACLSGRRGPAIAGDAPSLSPGDSVRAAEGRSTRKEARGEDVVTPEPFSRGGAALASTRPARRGAPAVRCGAVRGGAGRCRGASPTSVRRSPLSGHPPPARPTPFWVPAVLPSLWGCGVGRGRGRRRSGQVSSRFLAPTPLPGALPQRREGSFSARWRCESRESLWRVFTTRDGVSPT